MQGLCKVQIFAAPECRDAREGYCQPRQKKRRAERTPILRAGRAGAEDVYESLLELPVDDRRPESIRTRFASTLLDRQRRADRPGQRIERGEIAGRSRPKAT